MKAVVGELVGRKYGASSHGSERGSTLVELLVAMVVIGILAAIAIPVFANQIKQSRIANAESLMKNLSQGAAIGFLEFPADGSAVTSAVDDIKPVTVQIKPAGSGVFSSDSKTVVAAFVPDEEVWRAAVWATDNYCTKIAYGLTGGGVPVTMETSQAECTISAADAGTLIPIDLTDADFFAKSLDPYGGGLVNGGPRLVWVNGQLMMTAASRVALTNPSAPGLVNGVIAARMQVGINRPGMGLVFRASAQTPGGMSGYSLQIDPGLGNKFALYMWGPNPATPGQAKEYRLAMTDFPPGFNPRVANDMRVEINGNRMRLFVNNGADPVMEYQLPDNGPMGSQYGFRNWGRDDLPGGSPNTAGNISVTPY